MVSEGVDIIDVAADVDSKVGCSSISVLGVTGSCFICCKCCWGWAGASWPNNDWGSMILSTGCFDGGDDAGRMLTGEVAELEVMDKENIGGIDAEVVMGVAGAEDMGLEMADSAAGEVTDSFLLPGLVGMGRSYSVRFRLRPVFSFEDLWSSVIIIGGDMPVAITSPK